MTAVEHVADGPAGPHPLAQGAKPAVIRSWLLPEDAERFDVELAAARDLARQSRDVTGVHDLLERWRGIAVAQSDPDAFRATVRRWAEIVTGESIPDDEAFQTTRAKAGI